MAEELFAGTFTRIFERVALEGDLRARSALSRLAIIIENKGKDNLSQATHPYGTATPAAAGGPPALISGTLRRCVTHTPIVGGFGDWSTKVGTGAGFYASYRGKTGTVASSTPASKYGYYLEMGLLRNGAVYQWLVPAYRWGITSAAPAIWAESFRGKW